MRRSLQAKRMISTFGFVSVAIPESGVCHRNSSRSYTAQLSQCAVPIKTSISSVCMLCFIPNLFIFIIAAIAFIKYDTLQSQSTKATPLDIAS